MQCGLITIMTFIYLVELVRELSSLITIVIKTIKELAVVLCVTTYGKEAMALGLGLREIKEVTKIMEQKVIR